MNLCGVIGAALLSVCAVALADEPSFDAFTYQGQLKSGGDPVAVAVDLKFRLYDAADEQVGPELVLNGFDAFDDEGRFTIDLAFGKGAFDGTQRWLEVEVDGVILTPRQPIMPTPYSVRALNVATVADSALAGVYSNALEFNNSGNQFAGSGAGLTSLNASNISTGTLDASLLPVGGQWSLAMNLNLGDSTLVVNPLTKRIGIGVDNPSAALHVVTGSGSRAIQGVHDAGEGITYGGYLQSSSTSGFGVFGLAAAGTGANYGVFGRSQSTSGRGVFAQATAASGTTFGIHGQVNSPDGFAGYFTGPVGSRSYFQRSVGIGTTLPTAPLHIVNDGSQRGLFVEDDATSGVKYVIYGSTASSIGVGVRGDATSGSGGYGVQGRAEGTSGTGVYAEAISSTGTTYGVQAYSSSSAGRALYGHATSLSGTNIGVYGRTNSSSGYAGYFQGGRNYFSGNVGIGTDTPSFGLDVATDARIGTQLRVESGLEVGIGASALLIESDALSANDLTVTADTNLQLESQSGEISLFSPTTIRLDDVVFVDTEFSRVGIGTETPTASLDVFSTSRFRSILRVDTVAEVGTGLNTLQIERDLLDAANDLTVTADDDLNIDSIFGKIHLDNNTLVVDPQTGHVGIGTASPLWQLQLTQNSAAKPTSGSWTIVSDARLKKNIHTIDHALADLLALRGVTYQWVDPSTQGNMDGTYTGLIAQEVERVFPEWIDESEDGFKRLTIIGFEGIVVEALRELRDEKDAEIAAISRELSTQLSEQRNINEELQSELAELRLIVEQLAMQRKGMNE